MGVHCRTFRETEKPTATPDAISQGMDAKATGTHTIGIKWTYMSSERGRSVPSGRSVHPDRGAGNATPHALAKGHTQYRSPEWLPALPFSF